MWVTPELAGPPGRCSLPPLISCRRLRGAQGKVPASPQEGARGLGSSRATGPPRWLSPGTETQPQIFFHGPLCASSPFLPALLHQAGMLALPQSRPLGMAVPRQTATLPRVPGREHCHRQGSGAGGHPRHRWGLWPQRPVPRYNTERIPLPKGSSHTLNPNSDGFLHPQNTRLISQKPQTLKEEGGGGIKKEKKKKKEFTMILPPLTGYRKTSVLLFLLIRVVLTCSIITLLSTYCAEAFPHSSASHSFLSGSCDAVTQRLSNQRCRNQKEKENGWRRRENKCPCFSLPLSFSSVPPPSTLLFFLPSFFFNFFFYTLFT